MILDKGERWKVVEGDALPVLWEMPDASVDAIITDPPYCAGAVSEASRTRAAGQGLRSENLRRFGWFTGDNMGTAGLAFLLRAVAFEAVRVVKPTGSLLVFCDWRMVASLQPAIESAGVRFQNLVVWDKRAMGLGTGFRAQHELILHFTFGSPEYHDMGTGNVIECGRVVAGEREHQTQKPLGVLSQLVRVVTPVGGLVADPFAGSGSTGCAAVAMGRRFVGMERDAAHVETARRRIAEAESRPSMFAPVAEAAPAPVQELMPL
jgi:site-specific DNA-methyltransferase (adenine-specific)